MKTKQNIHAALTLASFAIPALVLGLTARYFNGQSLLALILIAAGFCVVRRQLTRQPAAGHNSSLPTNITPYNVSGARSIHEDHHERAHRDAAESQRRRTRALEHTNVRQPNPTGFSPDTFQTKDEAMTRALPKENHEATT